MLIYLEIWNSLAIVLSLIARFKAMIHSAMLGGKINLKSS